MTTEERLETLERELIRAKRRDRWLLVGIGLAVMGGFLGWTGTAVTAHGQAPAQAQKEIRANAFILEDDKGQVRARLHLLFSGRRLPSLELLDEKGEVGVRLSMFGPALVLSGANSESRAVLSVLGDITMLNLVDASGNVRTELSVFNAGSSLKLSDAKGKVRATLGAAETETPDGRTTSYPESSLLLFGPDGKVIWGAPR